MRETLASFIPETLGESGRRVSELSDGFIAAVVGGPSRPLAFTATTAKYQVPSSSVANSYEVAVGLVDRDAVVEIVGVAAVENAKAREVIEQRAVDLRDRRGPLECRDAARGADHGDRERRGGLTVRAASATVMEMDS